MKRIEKPQSILFYKKIQKKNKIERNKSNNATKPEPLFPRRLTERRQLSNCQKHKNPNANQPKNH